MTEMSCATEKRDSCIAKFENRIKQNIQFSLFIAFDLLVFI